MVSPVSAISPVLPTLPAPAALLTPAQALKRVDSSASALMSQAMSAAKNAQQTLATAPAATAAPQGLAAAQALAAGDTPLALVLAFRPFVYGIAPSPYGVGTAPAPAGIRPDAAVTPLSPVGRVQAVRAYDGRGVEEGVNLDWRA